MNIPTMIDFFITGFYPALLSNQAGLCVEQRNHLFQAPNVIGTPPCDKAGQPGKLVGNLS